MYRVNAIILYRQAIRDNHIRTVLFSEEFGKITAWEKRQEIWDIGNRVEVLIDRIGWQNQIKKLDITNILSLDTWSYDEVIEYLILLQILYEALPEWGEQRYLYRDMREFLDVINTNVWKVCILYIMQARILKRLGYLSKSYYEWTSHLMNLYESMTQVSMKSMLHKIESDSLSLWPIKKSILEARHTYTHRN